MRTFVLIAFLLMTSVAYGQDVPDAPIPLSANVQRVTERGSGNGKAEDPTKLTTEAVDRLKEQLMLLFNEKFRAMEKDLSRLQKILDESPDAVTSAIADSEKLTAEKFKGLSDQQVQRDNNLALALTAQQKSVADQNLSNLTAADKAEKNFKELITGIQSLLAQQEKTATDKINDLKDQQIKAENSLSARVQAIESRGEGGGAAITWVIAAISVLFGSIGGILGLISFFKQPSPIPLPVVNYETNGNGNGARRRT